MAAVQALARAPVALPSPATSFTSLPTPMTAHWGAGALHQRLNAFVKKSLIQQLVPTGAVVCDLYCGRGVDTGNWAEARIGKYVGVDLSSSALEEAKEQWEKNGKQFAARFCELNPCMVGLEKNLGEDRFSADVVTCLAHLQDCFATEDMVRQLLKNVAALLKPGGYFFGATPDSSTIWYKYQKAVEGAMKAGSLRANGHLPRVRTDLYSINFEDDRFNQYGSKYQLRFTDDTVPPQSQILVHFPSLIRHAEEFGLEYVEIQNLTEFYEDYRVPFAETLQNSCGTLLDSKGNLVVDGKSRLSPIAQDVLSLYTTFIFKKPDPQQRVRALKRPAPPVPSLAPTPPSVDVKKIKKPSPATTVQIAAPEETPFKKRFFLAPVPSHASNGSKVQDPIPKQDKSSSSASRSKAEAPLKNEPDRSGGKCLKDGELKLSSSQVNVSQLSLEKPSKLDISITESRDQLKSDEKVIKMQSPSTGKLCASEGQKTDSPSASKSKATGGQRNDIPNLRAEAIQLNFNIMHGSSGSESGRPSSGGLRPESQLKIESVEREKRDTEKRGNDDDQSQEPAKRKRVSRWSSEYVPKLNTSTEEQNTEWKAPTQQPGQGSSSSFSADKQLEKSQSHPTADSIAKIEGDVVSKPAISAHEAQVASGASQVGEHHCSENATNNASDSSSLYESKYDHYDPSMPLKFHYQRSSIGSKERRNERVSIQRKNLENGTTESTAAGRVELIEEGEVVTELVTRNTSSPKKDRPVATTLHYERRSAQKAERSGTVAISSYRQETVASDLQSRNMESIRAVNQLEGDANNSDSKVGPAMLSNHIIKEFLSEKSCASGSEALVNDNQPQESSKQEISSVVCESDVKTTDQDKRESMDPCLDRATNEQKRISVSISTQESLPKVTEVRKVGLNPKPRKKEIALDLLLERTTNLTGISTASCVTVALETTGIEPPSEKCSTKNREGASNESELGRRPVQNKDSSIADLDFEKGSKSNRDSPAVEHQPDEGCTHKKDTGASAEPSTSDPGRDLKRDTTETDCQLPRGQGFKKENIDSVWETKSQRFTAPRRPTSQLSEGAAENPPPWNRGSFGGKIDRDPQGRGHHVYPPRNPYANSTTGYSAAPRPPLRAALERRVVGHPLQGGAGLLGAAPSPGFADRGLPADRRFDTMGPPECGRSYSDLRGSRPIRGPVYKDRVSGVPRGQPDFVGEGNNGLGASWDDHFQGDGRSRNR